MISRRKKILFLALTFIIPFSLYTLFYYKKIVTLSKYNPQHFVYLEFEKRDIHQQSLLYFNSSKKQLLLNNRQDTLDCEWNKKEQEVLLDKVGELGFWNLPTSMENQSSSDTSAVTYSFVFHFRDIQFSIHMSEDFRTNYKQKSTFDSVRRLMEKHIGFCLE